MQRLSSLGAFDALICAAGQSRFGTLGEANDEGFRVSIGNKLMGQVLDVRGYGKVQAGL